MTTVVLVPRRADNGIRDAIWAYLFPGWEEHGLTIHEGHHEHHEGPFNRSRAINRAARAAGAWTRALIIDADIWVPPKRVRMALDAARQSDQLAYAHTQWWGTTATTRDELLTGSRHLHTYRDWPEHTWDTRTPLSNSCCMAITRQLWDEIGGYDERFEGWGAEDWMFYDAALTLRRSIWRQDGPVIHLHHPLTPESEAARRNQPNELHDANVALGKRWNAAKGNKRKIRELIAEARMAAE